MDPSVSTEVEGEPKERKKIQFAVPASAPTNLDPRQVEMCSCPHALISSISSKKPQDINLPYIRRRRPTPATLFRVADQSSPEDDQSTHQKMAEAHMQNLGVYPAFEDPCEGEEDEDQWQGEDTSPTKVADHQETAATESSVKFSNVRETAKQIQAAQEEEDEEDEEEGDKIEETTEENSRGSN
ncbi:Protein phosphatase 1 regulatory subunit 1B DARPP-32 [Collichthys lucidus]|uniref:Protein phosphatase 1 regulatory subunit 1B n=1 Tax=Collichthys lucidus TaxID=240159 RepID=A0A4U5VW31_COLLU|nr:Protein phosphatase 1 regulatory subunit 1B DARPP-32 [Collichthys lucidus]